MLNKDVAYTVAAMIRKECCRTSLKDLCEYWDITPDDFDLFLECAFRYIDLDK